MGGFLDAWVFLMLIRMFSLVIIIRIDLVKTKLQ